MAQRRTTPKRKTPKAPARPKRTAARKRRATVGEARKPAAKKAPATAPKSGTTLKRTFKGKACQLKVTRDGFVLGDVTFRSLTAAAKAVTQYPSISGPRFWLGTDSASKKGGAK